MRSIGSEFLSVSSVLSIPVGILLSFPFGALGFRASEGVFHPPRAAFVEVTPESERQALRAVRAAWRGESGGARRLQADLFCSALPEDEHLSVLSIRERSRLPDLPVVGRERMPFLPSLKAPPPASLKAETSAEPLAFSREDLLKMN